MNRQSRLFCIFAALLFAIFAPAEAQTISTQGKEFWVSFMANGNKYHPDGPNDNWILTQVLISAKNDCSGTISNPNTGWSYSFNVTANNVTPIEIPEDQAYHEATLYEQIAGKGLFIQTDDTVSVYCTNIAYVSFDASFVLPAGGLSDDYIIQTYDQSTAYSNHDYVYEHQTSAFLIIATEDNTAIDITPTAATLSGRPAGEEFSITLNKGQTYQVRSTLTGSHRDLSGTRVTARDCKKIAVFNGNTVTCIPNNEGSFDHIFEQAMPLRSWGKNFVVTQSMHRKKDYVKITSSADNNIIRKNGETLCTLNACESHIFELSNSELSCFIEATYPSAVYLYNKSYEDSYWNPDEGDPSVVWIAPVEQRINEVTFTTFDNENIDIESHYVNIIVKAEDISRVVFDNQQIPPSDFSRVQGNDEYSYTRKEISHAVHHISCINGFNAHVYGFCEAKGYAYMVGSNATNLTCSTTINGIVVQPGETFSYCVDEPAIFTAQVNYPEYSLEWDFGDGTTSTDNPATHTYHDKTVYDAKLIVTIQGSTLCDDEENYTTRFLVDIGQHYTTPIITSICSDEGYHENGFDIDIIPNDTILGTTVSNPANPSCPDSLLIYITANQSNHYYFTDYRCWDGTPGFYDDHHVFSFPYNSPDNYHVEKEVENDFGCIDTYTLDLTVADIIRDTLKTKGCNIYPSEGLWNGRSFDSSGFYSAVTHSDDGCDTTHYLDLSMNYTPSAQGTLGEEINAHNTYAAHQVIPATEFQICTYTFSITEENPSCEWDSVLWNLHTETGEEVDWLLEPFVDDPDSLRWSCHLTAFEYIPGKIIITATAYNECSQPEGITFQNWLVCSFYGVNEAEFAIDILIQPNPNNGEMDIQLLNTDGITEAKAYDMAGNLIDRFEITGNTCRYSMKKHAPGIYLFVFNNKGQITTRKVCID